MSETGNLARIVVDEAHCTDNWEHDFWPSYCKLCLSKNQQVQMVAFTCTALLKVSNSKIHVQYEYYYINQIYHLQQQTRENLNEWRILQKQLLKNIQESVGVTVFQCGILWIWLITFSDRELKQSTIMDK